MKQVYLSDVSATPPTLPAGAVAGYPQDGTLTGSHQATVPGPYWFYSVSSEIENAIIAGGKTPDASRVDQLAEVIGEIHASANAVSYLPQTLTAAQRLQAKRNLDLMPNVRDFGATGDGTTDDTAAFQAAATASAGGAVFVPPGTYRLTASVGGLFVSLGGVSVSDELASVIDLTALSGAIAEKVGMRQVAIAALTGSALKTLPDYRPDGWSSGIQGLAYDKYAGVLYAINNWRNQGTWIHAFDAATNALLGTSYLEQTEFNVFYGGWAHQGLAVYRPTESDPAGVFFAGANTYTASGVEDKTRVFTLNLNRWDYTAPTSYVTERHWTLFSADQYDITGGVMNVNLSEDGTELCAMAKRLSDGAWTFAIWNVADILAAGDGVNVYGLAKQLIVSPWGDANIAGQATALDDSCIYCLYSNAGNNPHQMRIIDRKSGAPVAEKLRSYEGFDVYGATTSYAEGETLTFMPANGSESHLCMGMQCVGIDMAAQPRTIRIFDLETGAAAAGMGNPITSMPVIAGDYVGNEVSTNMRTVATLMSNRDTAGQSCAYLARFRNNDTQGAARNSYLAEEILENGERYQGAGTILHFADGALSSGEFGCFASNPLNLGSAASSWQNAYLSANPIIVSDERAKQDICAWSDEVLDAWADVDWCSFRMRDAVAKKGDAARIHAGLIAQRIKAVFEKHGLDACRYGLLCHDAWGDDEATGAKAGDRYSVRYEEALAVEAAYQRRRADRLEARIEAIEKKLGG